ncbi:MAG: hypothetical protein KDA71_15985, partial [Planctomycetales bacterium]|nr:hypothetical protein [Planctomycetales bacterium]
MTSDPCRGARSDIDRERAGIWQNEYRNKMIAADARKAADDGHQVLISVRTIEHAMFLKKELPDFTLCYSQDGVKDPLVLDWYRERGCIGEDEPVMTLERRRKLKAEFEAGRLRKVIANSVWKRGVDFRQLQFLIRADAESSAIADTQIPGRTSRICDEVGKNVSVVRDYLDQFNSTWRERALRRASHYRQLGWEQRYPISPYRRRGRKAADPRQRELF